MSLFLNLLPLIMVAASMGVSVYLFVTLKKEIHDSATGRENAEAKLALEFETLKKRTQQIELELAEAAIPGMTLSKRSQAVRRMRRGEGPELIASALSLPLKEVELLIKVEQRLSSPTS
jgi:hypothetical protein